MATVGAGWSPMNSSVRCWRSLGLGFLGAHCGFPWTQARLLAKAPRGGEGGGALTIREPSAGDAAEEGDVEAADMEVETDEDFARQMQAKLDAQDARRGCDPARLPPRCLWTGHSQACLVSLLDHQALLPPIGEN